MIFDLESSNINENLNENNDYEYMIYKNDTVFEINVKNNDNDLIGFKKDNLCDDNNNNKKKKKQKKNKK